MSEKLSFLILPFFPLFLLFAGSAVGQDLDEKLINSADQKLGSLSFLTATPEIQNSCPKDLEEDINNSYIPSRTLTFDEIQKVYNGYFKGNRAINNQCYMRAHMWSYQMWRKKDVKLLKIFAFFTHSAPLKGHNWWFHVAPLVIDKDGNSWVLDKQFSVNKPVSIRDWLDIFLVKGTSCPQINHFKIYEENKKSETFGCFIRIVPMYYLTPEDIEEADKERKPRDSKWIPSELWETKEHFNLFDRRKMVIDKLE